MKSPLAFFFLFLINISLIGQNPNFNYSRPSLQNIESIEKSVGGIQTYYNYTISVDSNYFPNAYSFDLDNPLRFNREYKRTSIETSYYYSKIDSTIRMVEYNWEFNHNSIAKLNRIFNKNHKSLTKQFNYKGQYKKDEMENNNGPWVRESVIWENTETYIHLFKINGAGTYRVRVLISYK